MHYTVPMPRPNMTTAEKEAAALNAARDYIGDQRRYKKVLEYVRVLMTASDRSAAQRVRSCYMALSFAGIQGRWPVRALIRAALA